MNREICNFPYIGVNHQDLLYVLTVLPYLGGTSRLDGDFKPIQADKIDGVFSKLGVIGHGCQSIVFPDPSDEHKVLAVSRIREAEQAQRLLLSHQLMRLLFEKNFPILYDASVYFLVNNLALLTCREKIEGKVEKHSYNREKNNSSAVGRLILSIRGEAGVQHPFSEVIAHCRDMQLSSVFDLRAGNIMRKGASEIYVDEVAIKRRISPTLVAGLMEKKNYPEGPASAIQLVDALNSLNASSHKI